MTLQVALEFSTNPSKVLLDEAQPVPAAVVRKAVIFITGCVLGSGSGNLGVKLIGTIEGTATTE